MGAHPLLQSTCGPGCGQQFQYPAQNLQISHYEGGPRGSGADMDRPCITWGPLEKIFVGAIVTGREDEVRIRKISEQRFEGFGFVRPDRLYFYNLFAAKSPEL